VARARTVFFGSGAFAVPVLEAVAGAAELSLEAVVTAPPRPAGRRAEPVATAVGMAAAAMGLPQLTPERLRDPAFLEALASVFGGRHLVAVVAEKKGKNLADVFLVVDDQDSGVHNRPPSGLTGRVMKTLVPSPTRLLSSISPPCALTMV